MVASKGTLGRFTGAIAAASVAVIVGGSWGIYLWMNQDPPEIDATPQVFTFEKDDLRGIKLTRPDTTIHFVQGDSGEWEWVGRDWRPSDSMVRRVGHQTHDLMARATLTEVEDLSQYGLGDGSITIELTLEGRDRPLVFEAGDPNPTSVSWYLRPVPGDNVYVVKKSAVDYWRMDVEDFREKRFAAFEADEAVAIDATVDGRTLAFRRVDARRWQQSEPITQRADRQMVRTMLGRTSALKASEFVEDKPSDLTRYGLADPAHQVRITLDTGETFTLHVGDVIVGSSPQDRYILRVEDDAVYRARDGFLEAFLESDEDYRDTRILYIEQDEVQAYTVHSERYEPLTIRRTPDGWRWPDDAAVSGITPRRVASEAADPRAVAFVDAPEEGVDYGFESSQRWVEIQVEGRPEPVVVRLGAKLQGSDGQGGPLDQQYLRVAGDETIYVVNQALDKEIDNLLNEYRRKLETDAEKGLLQPEASDTDAVTGG